MLRNEASLLQTIIDYPSRCFVTVRGPGQYDKKSKVRATTLTLFLFLLMVTNASAQSTLSDSLMAYLRRLGPDSARVSMAVQSLTDSRVSFAYRADERVPSASVIKLPIMLEAMERVKAGTMDLSEIHILTDSEKVGGSGVLKTYSHRSRISYRELLRLMLIYSDNTATNIFINELGLDAINVRMRDVGLTKSRLSRVMMDTLAAQQGRENYVTAGEMNTLLAKIYRYDVATPALCEDMLSILKENDDALTIPRLLPKGTVVAHKTGTLAYVRGDAGIVYATQPFVVSVFVEGVPTASAARPDAEQIIGEIALICYQYFSRP